jgi:Protein of unknown function (DUF559)
MLKSRAWRRLLPDVYVATAAYASGDHRMWCSAAALAIPPGAALGGWSAAYLHGVDVLPQDARVWINLPVPGRMRPRRRLAVHRTPMRPHELDGYGDIPVTIPLRTAFDLGRRLPRTDALVAVDAMCHRLLTLDQLARHAAERDGWPGIQQLREVILLSDPLAESPMESRTRLLLHDGGAPPVVAQYEVRTASGRLVARLDLAYPRWRIGIEYEGDHHRDRDQFRSDIARHNELREMGWLILHFTADDVLRHPDRLLRQVTAAVHHRR